MTKYIRPFILFQQKEAVSAHPASLGIFSPEKSRMSETAFSIIYRNLLYCSDLIPLTRYLRRILHMWHHPQCLLQTAPEYFLPGLRPGHPGPVSYTHLLTELFSENQNKKTKTIKIICVLNTKRMFPFLVKTFIFLKIDFNYSNTSKGRSTSIFLPLNFDDLYSAYREFCCSGK